MKIAIYGAGKYGESIFKEIQESAVTQIMCSVFIDNNPIYYGKKKYGIPIIGVEKFISSYRNSVEGVLIAAMNFLVSQEMVISLLKRKYYNIYLSSSNINVEPVLQNNGEWAPYIKHYSCLKPVLPYLEYHVSDYCNLKCRGCGHFSNLVTRKEFPRINEFRNSFTGLSKRFSDIKVIRLMGGEPFVNPDLDMFLYEARKIFPYADIRIVSNGLLLPTIQKKIFKAVRECGAVVDISLYPPTQNRIKEIIGIAEKEEVKVHSGKPIKMFFKPFSANINAEYENIYQNCVSKGCYFLRRNFLYHCAVPILMYENKEFLDFNIDFNDVVKNSFDIESGKENGWDIIKTFSDSFEFCGFCTQKEWFEWDISHGIVNREDWIAEE